LSEVRAKRTAVRDDDAAMRRHGRGHRVLGGLPFRRTRRYPAGNEIV
jgi:hypothetical protein